MTDQTQEIHMQVMWNRLISVVEEQAMTLLRTAFSTSVREAGDLSAGVFDPQGRMLAQAVTGTPGHVNTMAEAVLHFITEIGRENMFPGDTYVTNDPWKGTGHLHDITMVSPAFSENGWWGSLPAPRMWWMWAGAALGRMASRYMKRVSRSRS